MSKETYEMCCMHWQKIIEKRFCFCTAQNLTVMLYDAIEGENFIFDIEALNCVTKFCELMSQHDLVVHANSLLCLHSLTVMWKRGILIMPPIVNQLFKAMQVSLALFANIMLRQSSGTA
ncbi:TPA: hypothetical protein ACH3X1_011996 [Trebouxia sp. C0004]